MTIQLKLIDFYFCLVFQHLIDINVSWCPRITKNGVEALARGCNNLKRFSSSCCPQIDNDAVIFLATYCRGLESLNLHSCAVSYSCI